jgi:hypothetical protein
MNDGRDDREPCDSRSDEPIRRDTCLQFEISKDGSPIQCLSATLIHRVTAPHVPTFI